MTPSLDNKKSPPVWAGCGFDCFSSLLTASETQKPRQQVWQALFRLLEHGNGRHDLSQFTHGSVTRKRITSLSKVRKGQNFEQLRHDTFCAALSRMVC
jgi:hypothetical protein